MPFSSVEWVVILTSLISGTLGALGIGSYLTFRERQNRQAQQRRQKEHLARLQRLVSRLLNACDRLLGGQQPQDTILYQRFQAHGGEYYPDIQTEVSTALQHSQNALRAAFEVHQKLLAMPSSRPLPRQIQDWETLYASLVGQSEHIRNMTGDELRTLLNPVLAAEPAPPADDLSAQLEELSRDLDGKPLRIKWQQIYPTQTHQTGILGYIEQVKTHLANLPDRHKQEAPYWLAEARFRRQAAEAEAPDFLTAFYRYILAPGHTPQTAAGEPEMTVPNLFANLDRRLAQAETAQAQGRFLDVIEQTHAIWQDVGVLKAFFQAVNNHGRRQAQLDALAAQGYRPPHIARDEPEIKEDVQTITRYILSGNYTAAAEWIEEFNIDSRRTLSQAESWQTLHRKNMAGLEWLRQRVAEVSQWRDEDVQPAWAQLQTYASPNWLDLAPEMEQALTNFRQLQTGQLEQINSLNSLEIQNLPEAERLLGQAAVDLSRRIEQQFQAVTGRLAELKTAESRLPDALRLTTADLERAETLRNREDAKIGPEVDRQIEQARQHLAEATRLADNGALLAAVNEQIAARQLALAAYAAANEQVRRANALQAELARLTRQVEEKIEQYRAVTAQQADVVQTAGTRRLARQLQKTAAQAEQARLATATAEDQALVAALETAIDACQNLNRQADWVLRQIKADQAEYDNILNQTLSAVAEAQAAIRQANRVLDPAGPDSAGRHALQRAEAMLPPADATQRATRQALARIRRQAKLAAAYARQVKSRARPKIRRLARARQTLAESGLAPEPEARPGRLQQPDTFPAHTNSTNT